MGLKGRVFLCIFITYCEILAMDRQAWSHHAPVLMGTSAQLTEAAVIFPCWSGLKELVWDHSWQRNWESGVWTPTSAHRVIWSVSDHSSLDHCRNNPTQSVWLQLLCHFLMKDLQQPVFRLQKLYGLFINQHVKLFVMVTIYFQLCRQIFSY